MKRGTTCALIACLLALCASTTASAGVIEDHYGKWLGKLSIPQGPTLATGIELFPRIDGSPGASLTVAEQGAFGLPVDQVDSADGGIRLAISILGIRLELRPGGDALVGTAFQGPMTFPIRLTRTADFGEPVRPQTPKPPLPYQAEDLGVAVADGTRLAGTFTRPRTTRPVVAVVLLTGSGPVDRDEAIMGHHPFAVLADYLTRRGIAVYRFDKRGIGRSTGAFASETTGTLTDDALAALNAVRRQPGISRVGVIGHSEGGLIAAKLAAEDPKSVDFVVSLAGPGLGGLDLMVLQDRVGYERAGLPPGQAQMLEDYGKRFYTIVIANQDVDARMTSLQSMFSSLSEGDRLLVRQHASSGSMSFANARLPALRDALMGNVAEYWRSVRCPTLALNGTLDIQVPAQENLEGIRAGLAAAGNRASQIEALPNLNHLFQTATTGLVSEYASISETMAPVALERISRFVQSQH